MNLPLFSDSAICATRAHCATCRSTAPHGQAFRRSLAKQFDGIEDICPHGVPWDWKPSTIPKAAPAKPRIPGPGDAVKMVLGELGIKPAKHCGCNAKAAEMNQWGWVGCLRHRKELIEWFAAKAKEQGITVDAAMILRALVAAFRVLRKSRRQSE